MIIRRKLKENRLRIFKHRRLICANRTLLQFVIVVIVVFLVLQVIVVPVLVLVLILVVVFELVVLVISVAWAVVVIVVFRHGRFPPFPLRLARRFAQAHAVPHLLQLPADFVRACVFTVVIDGDQATLAVDANRGHAADCVELPFDCFEISLGVYVARDEICAFS